MKNQPRDLTVLGSLFALCFLGLCFVGSPAWFAFIAVSIAVAFFTDLLWHEAYPSHGYPHPYV